METTRVGLDTCVIRGLAYEQAPLWLKTFQSMAKAHFRFSLMDHAMIEFANQVANESLSIPEKNIAVGLAETFLDSEFPVLPGGISLMAMSGVGNPRHVGPGELTDQEFGTIIWSHIKKTQDPGELSRPFVVTNSHGKRLELELDVQAIVAELEDARARWKRQVKVVDKMPPGEIAKKREQILSDLQDGLANHHQCSPSLDVRLDFLLRHRLRFAEQRNRSDRSRLNPDSKKRRNDGIDFRIGATLGLPALVCVEQNYADRAPDVGGYQAQWVFTASGLADAFDAGRLPVPSFPLDAIQQTGED